MVSDIRENMVATVVDVSSILFAYNMGIHNMGLLLGLGYAGFDAWLVIWQRRRITRCMVILFELFGLRRDENRGDGRYIGRLFWDKIP